jgi:hypothetical protein
MRAMGDLTQSFFLGVSHMGDSPREAEFIHAELQSPLSYAYFCPECGEVWARAVIPSRRFMVWTIPCSLHRGGVFSLLWDEPYNAALPRAVLINDFTTLLRSYDVSH